MADLPAECNIRVVCRVRPMNDMEERNGSKSIVKVQSDDSLVLSSKTYNFDRVFKQSCTQDEVYTAVAKPIVADVLSGFNGTIFAYGQTSSGKTYTMEGEIGQPDREGIIPRIISDIFNYIYQMDENLEFHIKVSYFEIYLDKIRDLLDITKTNLSVHEDKNRVPYVKGATERFVSSPEEVLETIEEGKMNRHVSVTNMNEHSSRSHSVLMINIKQENKETEKKLNGKLYLVDLAGSEKVSKTGAEGSTLDEAKNINKSLSALGNVIAALAEGNKAHVPYRDSKLTRILQESLGGNARTTIVICCSPASYNESETKSTLLFGVRAKTIKNVVTVNEELTADEWRRRYEKERDRSLRLRNHVFLLEQELARWRRGESVASDEQVPFISHLLGSGLGLGMTPGEVSAPAAVGAGLQTMTPSLSLTQLSSISSQSLPSLTVDERRQYEDEKRRLCEQLDDKDDEYTDALQQLEKLRAQIAEQEELLNLRQREFDAQQAEMQRMQAENDAAKDEVKEVLTALEELAGNYEQKSAEADAKRHENELLAEELTSKLSTITAIEAELDRLREQSLLQRRRIADLVSGLVRDVTDAMQILPAAVGSGKADGSSSASSTTATTADRLEDDVMTARMNVGRMKSELKTLASKLSQMEREHDDWRRMGDGLAVESAALREAAKERQIRVELAEQQLSEAEARQAQLEAELEQAHAELGRLRGNAPEGAANGAATNGASGTAAGATPSSEQAAAAAAAAVVSSTAVEQLQRQLGLVRQEVRDKQAALEQLRDSNRQLTSAVDRLQMELERARRDDADKAAQLAELQLAAERREQARQELRGLEETVNKELQTLHTLRRLFVQDLQAKLKRWTASAASQQQPSSAAGGDGQTGTEASPAVGEDENGATTTGGGSVIAQRQKINFLETNLEQLTRVHKQLVRDNADLRCELPKLEKRLRTTMDRVKTLEGALREAKESAMRDRRRYQMEVDRIKEAVRQRGLTQRRAHVPQIVKPVARPPVLVPATPTGTGATQPATTGSDTPGAPRPVVRPMPTNLPPAT